MWPNVAGIEMAVNLGDRQARGSWWTLRVFHGNHIVRVDRMENNSSDSGGCPESEDSVKPGPLVHE